MGGQSGHVKTARPKRQFGHYECKTCCKKWTSSHAFQGIWQECTRCHGKVKPTNLQNIAPSFEHTYKCQSDGCKTVHIVCSQLREELKGFMDKPCQFTCPHNSGTTIDRIPVKCFFYHPSTIQLCAQCDCNKCVKAHDVHLFLECNNISQLTSRCTVCQSCCVLQKAQKVKTDLSVQHQKEHCQMCKKLGKYCGR